MDCWQGFARARARPWSSAAKRASARPRCCDTRRVRRPASALRSPRAWRRRWSSRASGATRGVWYGLPFGAGVWAFGYLVLPQLGVYEPIWKYDLETLGKDLSPHLVFGIATAAAFRLLAHGAVDK
jgi:hypothetical protein